MDRNGLCAANIFFATKELKTSIMLSSTLLSLASQR